MKAPSRLVIASRESALAMWQAQHIRTLLRAHYPDCAIDILGMTTEGDRRLEVSLARIGGKGLFVKELEAALEDGRADLAVHSMKDLPMELPPGYALAAIGAREDARDALVARGCRSFAELPPGAVVGTSSLRRESLIRAAYPGLRIEPLRGNVGTRLARLDEGRYDAIVLAAAGLRRLGHGARIAALLPVDTHIPAVGQGALGIECRSDRPDLIGLLAPLGDATTSACVSAERAFSHALAGSCNVPLGGHAVLDGERMTLAGFVATPDGARVVRDRVSAVTGTDPAAAAALGLALAERLKARGAAGILAALAGGAPP
jgi:hydroxymethylbilane synthase